MAEVDDPDRAIDIVTEQEQEFAQKALSEYKTKNYAGALQYLNKLERSHDYKVAHNKAVVEYYKSDLRKTDTFQKNLSSLRNQFKIKIDRIDDVDQSIIHYNEAVLLYHQRQYTAAIQIMEKVYKFIEPMDDSLARQVSLFAIDLQLCIRQPDKALNLITYVETHLLNGAPNIRLLDKNAAKEKEKKIPLDAAGEEFKKKLMKRKVRCYLMNRNLEAAGRDLKELHSKEKTNYEYLFFAANSEYLRGNLLEAQQLLGGVPNDYYVYSQCGESSTVLFYNNMGVLHFVMGKPNLACHYFQMALKEDIAQTNILNQDTNDKLLFTLGGSKHHEIMHNLGISLLYSKRPAQAFECLLVAVRRYHRNSRLWLRLAECCLLVHKESNEMDYAIHKKQKEIIVDVVGSRNKQKVVFTTHLSKDRKYNSETQSYAVPVPCIEFASLCLRNAHSLLPSETNTTPVPLFLMPGLTPPVPSLSPGGPAPSSPLSPNSLANLRNSILAASAYVALCMGDYVLALREGKELLKQPHLSGAHRLLGHLYCAESLVLSDKIADALEHLNPENVKDIDLEFGEEPKKKTRTTLQSKWYPDSLATAHATMNYNIAVAKAIRGQLPEAFDLLKQIWQISEQYQIPGHIIMLILYIELKLGHPDSARKLINQYLLHNKT